MSCKLQMHYPLGWPAALWLHNIFGLPLQLRVKVIYDDEVGVYIGTSPDISGLVIEAETLEGLTQEIALVLPELIHVKIQNSIGLDLQMPDLKIS